MTFVGDGGEIDAAYLARFDFVLDMVDRDMCREFVARVVGGSGPEARARLERAVKRPFGARSAHRTANALAADLRELPGTEDVVAELEGYAREALDGARDRLPDDRLRFMRALRTKHQKGGAPPPDDVSDMDVRPYRVLQLADAIHDFADGSVDGDGAVQMTMQKDIGCVLPEAFVPGERRRRLTLLDLADKSKFVRIMGANSALTFDGVEVVNPMQDLDFEKHMYEHVDHESDESLAPKSVLHDGATAPKQHVEIFCRGVGAATVLDLVELAELRDTVVATFGPNLKFVVDQNTLPDHPNAARSPPFIVAWLLGFRNVVAELADFHDVRGEGPEFVRI